MLLLYVLKSLALDKRIVMKPAPTAGLRVHHCQGREHPSVRETSEFETPPRGGKDAVGRIQRACSFFCYMFFMRVHLLYMGVFFSIFLTSSIVSLKLSKFLFLS